VYRKTLFSSNKCIINVARVSLYTAQNYHNTREIYATITDYTRLYNVYVLSVHLSARVLLKSSILGLQFWTLNVTLIQFVSVLSIVALYAIPTL